MKTWRSAGRTYLSAVASIDSGSDSQVGATSSLSALISSLKAWLARQSAAEKKLTNWRSISARSDPNSR